MLNYDLVPKINNNVLKRHEIVVGKGVLFLFDVETEKVWIGNSSSKEILNLIDGKKSLKSIYDELKLIFHGFEYSAIKKSFDNVLQDLFEKNMIEFINLQS